PRTRRHSPSFPPRRSSDLAGIDALTQAGEHVLLPDLPDAPHGNEVVPLLGVKADRVVGLEEPLQKLPSQLLVLRRAQDRGAVGPDRKSTRLNSSHVKISYA